MKNRIRIASALTLVVVAVCGAVFGSFTLMERDAHALSGISASDVEKYKNNIMFKVYYANLKSCYIGYMQHNIDQSSINSNASFDSETYFTNTGKVLHFPWAIGTDRAVEASCPDFITGWKTNWWQKLWGNDSGNFGGFATATTTNPVPGDEGFRNSEKMGDFLKAIGYKENSTADGDLSDRKCFYITADLANDYNGMGNLPISKGTHFETIDYCFKVKNTGEVDPASGVVALQGTNDRGFDILGPDDDSGHIRGSQNIMVPEIPYASGGSGYQPKFETVGEIGSRVLILNSTIRYFWFYSDSTFGWPNDAQEPSSDACTSLGYKACVANLENAGIPFLQYEKYYGSLMNPTAGGGARYPTFYEIMQSAENLFKGIKDYAGRDFFDHTHAETHDPKHYDYTKQTDVVNVDRFLKYFLGSNLSAYNNGGFTKAEQYVLYWYYLRYFYDVSVRDDEPVGSNSYKVNWLTDDGKFTETYIYSPRSHADDKQYSLSTITERDIPGGNTVVVWGGVSKDWEWFAKQLQLINVESAFSEQIVEIDDPVNPIDPNKPPVPVAEDPCYKAGASLGWIICPVIKIVSDTLEGVYNNMIKPFLEIQSSWMEAGSSQSVYDGWSAFRNFANIIFAILFLIVILSQVTGFGLDNYGIKKILPRLIMVAVLVNISFILCQLAVDVSNILGSALQGLFHSLADQITVPAVEGFNVKSTWFSLSGIVSSIGTTLFAGVAVAALWVSWEVWLIPFLLALLGCVIGVIFFFIILGVRQAGVLILVALSPIAIVCYALPNTKSLFDRWKKMFVGLLVVYPICGILIGGGQFASALLIAAGQETRGDETGINFFYALVAMLISVVPFFFIPSILRSSMAALGNIGTKIAGFGSRLSGGVRGAILGSEGGKEWQRRFNMMNAERTFDRMTRRIERGDSSRFTARRRSNAAARYNRLAMEDFKAGGNQELLLPGSRGWQGLEAKQLAADTEGQRELYASQMNTGNAGLVGDEYEKQLEALQANPNNRSALVKMRALHDILSESDPGRSEIRNRMLKMAKKYASVYQGFEAGAGAGSALSLAAGHLMDNYNGLLKKSNRGLWSMLGNFQGGDFTPLFGNGGVQESGGDYTSSYYDQLGLNGYNAMSLIEADDAVRDGINRGIADGSISGANKSNIVSLASEAYGNQNVHFQPKVAEQIRKTLIDGNTAATIGGMDTGALERLAGDISKGTLSGASRDKLVGMAKTALKTPGFVTNAEHAAQLNNILAAAGQETIPFAGQINVQDTSADSGSINLRGGVATQGGRTAGGVILPDGQTLDAIGEMMRQDQAKEAIRRANDRKFNGK